MVVESVFGQKMFMNIYLDESYNLQKKRGKMFISINGFAVLNDKILRKRWKEARKEFVGKRRIHATDTRFAKLREESIRLLGRFDLTILSVFQLVYELPPQKYFASERMNFETVYFDLVKALLVKLSINEYRRVRIVVDARKHKGGILAQKKFYDDLTKYFMANFQNTICSFHETPSFMDVLVELADFVSNIFYREFQHDELDVFSKFGFKIIQIKNPLSAD